MRATARESTRHRRAADQAADRAADQAADRAADRGADHQRSTASDPDQDGSARGAAGQPAPGRRLRRAERRDQILTAATRAFARTGFAATSLDDVAAEAGISRVILYRHFDSKTDLYRAVLDGACTRLDTAVGTDNFTPEAIPALVRAAGADPDGFRLLFRYAAREPEFRDYTDHLTAASVDVAHRHLAAVIPDERWTAWAARLAFAVAIEGVIAWLDAGQPDPEQAADHIGRAIGGVIEAAQPAGDTAV